MKDREPINNPFAILVIAFTDVISAYVRGFGAVFELLHKAAASFYGLPFLLEPPHPPRHEALERKLKAAVEALNDASRYMDAIQNEMQVERENLEKARKDYEHYRHLADTEKEKASAFLMAMSSEVASAGKKERKWAFFLGIISNLVVFFFLGVAASEPVKNSWRAVKAWFQAG